MDKGYKPSLDKEIERINCAKELVGVTFETGIGKAKVIGPCKLYPERDVLIRAGEVVWTWSANKVKRMVERGNAKRPT